MTEIHGNNMPSDVVEITKEQHTYLLDGQSEGKEISGDDDGNPILVDVVVPDPTYKEKRQDEYPSIGDQLDALFKAGVFPSDMAAQIQAIKDKYPKA